LFFFAEIIGPLRVSKTDENPLLEQQQKLMEVKLGLGLIYGQLGKSWAFLGREHLKGLFQGWLRSLSTNHVHAC